MKKILCSLLAFCCSASLFAQISTEIDKYRGETKNLDTVAWIHSGNLALGLNEGILHNWSAGGELASLTFNGVFSGSISYYHHRSSWSNQLDAAYGLFYAYSNDFVPRKTDDRIDFTSKYGYRLNPKKDFYFVGLLNVRTQFSKGYNYDLPDWGSMPTSNCLSPLYIIVSPGFEYRKGTLFSVFFSPVAARFTFSDKYYTSQLPEGAFGIDSGKTSRFELGAYLSAQFQKDLTPNINYKSRLDLYSNYLAKNKYENGELIKKDNPGNIDIMWDNFIAIKLYKLLSVQFGLTMIYDNDVPFQKTYLDAAGVSHDIEKEPIGGLGWWQIKQMFSIGFNYKF